MAKIFMDSYLRAAIVLNSLSGSDLEIQN